MDRRLAAILAADIVGYSQLMGEDEEGTLKRVLAWRHHVVDPAVLEHRGRVFKSMGDGLLAEFGSVVDAVRCGIALQTAMDTQGGKGVGRERLRLRIGINLGDVIAEGDDVFGDGVNVAARLESVAPPGGIAVSGFVRDQIGDRLDVFFADLGEHQLKNIARPVRVYSIQHNRGGEDGRVVIERARSRCSIAVLPFDNMSGDPEQEYFSDGLTEDIITDLSKLSNLSVVARNTVIAYKGKAVRVSQAARELEVSYLLQGSVRKSGQRVRISAQLIDGADGSHIWADRYDRELTDIFAIQDQITHAIVGQLRVKLLPGEEKALTEAETVSVEAYTYYLRGRHFSHMCPKSYLHLARRMFAKAAEIDPSYARAYAGIADCDSMLRGWHGATDVSLDIILATAGKALAIDPDLAEAHASRGLALQLSGDSEAAVAEYDRALQINPDQHGANFFYARFHFARRNFEQAARYFERAAALRRDDYRSPVLLASVYRALDRPEERADAARLAVERAEKELDLHPENSGPAQLGALALAYLGEREQALDWAARALAIDPDDFVTSYNVICTYAQLGLMHDAISLLEKTLSLISSAEQVRWLHSDSDLDALRSNPRFQDLIGPLDRS